MIDSAHSEILKAGFYLLIFGLLINQNAFGQEALVTKPAREIAPVLKRQANDVSKSAEKDPVTLSDFHYVAPSERKEKKGLLEPFRKYPGVALLGSAAVPGLSQAANGKWVRTGLYVLAEAVTLGLNIHLNNKAERQQRDYNNYVNGNWSVVKYAKWLVDYNNYHEGTDIQYNDLGHNLNGEPAYNNDVDWDRVNINKLRELENQTIYYYPDGHTGEHFSHEIPDYGSQQYYELVSKYYQFAPGWRDFGPDRDNPYEIEWGRAAMPDMWKRGVVKAENFNDNYRIAGNMLTLMIVNHVVSAFDAFFTVTLKNHRLEAQTTPANGGMVQLKYHF